MTAHRILIDKTLWVFLRVGGKCEVIDSSCLLFRGQYPTLNKIECVERKPAVLQMTYLCAFLRAEVMVLKDNIERCQKGALAERESITPDILHGLSIEGIIGIAFIVAARLPAEKSEIDRAAQRVRASIPCHAIV